MDSTNEMDFNDLNNEVFFEIGKLLNENINYENDIEYIEKILIVKSYNLSNNILEKQIKKLLNNKIKYSIIKDFNTTDIFFIKYKNNKYFLKIIIPNEILVDKIIFVCYDNLIDIILIDEIMNDLKEILDDDLVYSSESEI
jgi:hypothetical protein